MYYRDLQMRFSSSLQCILDCYSRVAAHYTDYRSHVQSLPFPISLQQFSSPSASWRWHRPHISQHLGKSMSSKSNNWIICKPTLEAATHWHWYIVNQGYNKLLKAFCALHDAPLDKPVLISRLLIQFCAKMLVIFQLQVIKTGMGMSLVSMEAGMTHPLQSG